MNKINIPIFFFSGTGNTWWVAQHLAKELSKQKFQAATYSIEQVSQDQVNHLVHQGDMIAIGYPIYGSDAPLNIQSFITALPKQDRTKPMLVFVTQAVWSGDGAYFIRPEVEAKGYQIRWAVHFNMPNNISLDLGLVFNVLLSLLRAKPANARKRIKKLATRVSEGRDWIMGRSPFFSLGWMQRIPVRKAFDKFQSGVLEVNPDRCNRCERCVRLCPVDNIQMVDGLPRHKDHCILCLRCFNYCPPLAIEAYGKPFNPDWYGEEPYQGPDPEFKPELLIKNNA